MDKKLILAVAGSGKTKRLVDSTNEKERILLITYTNANKKNLKERIILKYGCIPSNLKIISFVSFLYSFCFKPFLSKSIGQKGITYNKPGRYDNSCISSNKWVYQNRISKLIQEKVIEDVIGRLEKYYDILMIDEFQDISAHDFELVMCLAKSNIKMLFVGDYFQHTFDTSVDGNKLNYLYKDYSRFAKLVEASGVKIDRISLSKSWRCSPNTCSFIQKNLKIEIESNSGSKTTIQILDNTEEAIFIFNDNEIVKLFEKLHYRYSCFSNNWGLSKGENKYNDICVVLTKTASDLLLKGKLHESKQLNKLYVAFSRARGNIYIMPNSLFKTILS